MLAGIIINFYRAMHFSAKRGIGIACRPSVCQSVTLVEMDQDSTLSTACTGWKSWKLISYTGN